MSMPPEVLRFDPSGLVARLLGALAAAQGGALTVKDRASGGYVHVDAALAAWLGRPASDLVGQGDAELFDGATAAALRAAEQTAAGQAAPLWSEHRIPLPGGLREFGVLRAVDARHVAAVWIDRAESRQREQQMRIALEQIEQHQRANAELRRELADHALRDPASGLNTRAHFHDQLRREVDLSTREHREFALVLVELDTPGEAVRERGEPARAHVLEAVGRLLRSGTRAMDTSCRWDDERFAVLLSGVGLATAHARMEGLRRRCATQIVLLDGVELGFTVAMGVASFPHTAQSLDALVAAAETALAEARRRGGNHVTLASIALAPATISP
ncbi:MAG: GGDEF domain-containing protein [Rubrivivax sp.]